MNLAKKCLFLFLLCTSQVVFAWNALGHMLIANIAYENLTPTARHAVDDLTADFNQEYPSFHSFQALAFWPDTLHEQKVEAFSRWHYYDNPFSMDGTRLINLVSTDNAVWAINVIEPILKNSQANEYERARFLAFFVHIVGDLHQPLHTVSRISAKHLTGDAGGNFFYVYWNNKRVSLHYLWDEAGGELDNDLTPDHMNQLTLQITSAYPPSYFGDAVNDLNPEDWLKEGMNVARHNVYDISENATPSQRYLSITQEQAEQRIALAGYRLANWLNEVFQ